VSYSSEEATVRRRIFIIFTGLLLLANALVLFSNTRPVAAANEGDLNNDGTVDIQDVAIVSVAFASYPGHPRWNIIAEMVQDNIIDIKDVAAVASNFGKIYW
jgi:hypothetical protein